jgi:amino acid transporter
VRVGFKSIKRFFLGEPLASHEADEQLLKKSVALPIFASDPLSSVAYAPQELLMILTLGGLSFLAYAPWVATGIICLLLVVVASYRQLIKAYPSGGGDYEVAHRNLGQWPGMIVAAALLVDYVMTVAVSIASGVDNIISAVPELNFLRVEMAIAFVVVLVAVNLRGVRESGRAFALPTYLFIGSVALTILVGLGRHFFDVLPQAESAAYTVDEVSMGQAAMILLLLRAFASGCATLTGVEAIANGVQAFRLPKIKNAQATLTIMGLIATSFFAGITMLALLTDVHYAENPCDLNGWAECATEPQRSAMAQIAATVYGSHSHPLFYLVQITTALVLLLAANTAFNGFPLLSSVLARDSYAPKALRTRGDRLVFSNGVISLGIAASLLLVIFRASLTQLIQMYIIGVFLSFTLGQTGMVIHWTRALREKTVRRREAIISRAINTLGMISTGAVLLIVTITKFTHGAWLVFAAMPLIIAVMYRTRTYYRHVDNQIRVDIKTEFGSSGDHAIVLIGRLHKPALKALDYAIAAEHQSLEAVHICLDPDAAERLKRAWRRHKILIPLKVIPSPYRDISTPLIEYIKEHREAHGSEVISIYAPQYIYGHWWEGFLHNRRAQQVRNRLMLFPGVQVILVPWLLDSSRALYTRPARPFPGASRRGDAYPTVPALRPRAAPPKAAQKAGIRGTRKPPQRPPRRYHGDKRKKAD